MKILVTGASGFIGKNLVDRLRTDGHEVFECTRAATQEQLDAWCGQCEFVFHLAGANRPETEAEFMSVNRDFTQTLADTLAKHKNMCPLLYTSSIQAERDNVYGKSKFAAEEILKKRDAKTFIYRLPNVFGKWSRPNYNSVAATFCHNAANGIPLRVDNPNAELSMVYIDDVVDEFINAAISGEPAETAPIYRVTVGRLAELVTEFKQNRDTKFISRTDGFEKKLYAMYTAYLSEDGLAYSADMHTDERGSFTELFKSEDRGQVSVNIIKPGVVKGNHYHHTKTEKFAVVCGSGVIRFRRVGDDRVIQYAVTGAEIRIVDIPCGYTHNIENTGSSDMAVVMWCSECYDPDRPDTYFLKV